MCSGNRNIKYGKERWCLNTPKKTMKIFNKIIKVLLIFFILFTASVGNAGVQVSAATLPISEAKLYSKGAYGNMLKYNGIEVLTTYVVYQKNGVEYPAYCIDPGIDGVGEKGSYTVKVNSLLNDVMLWRVITNGYPYKTISELGCNTKEEAYTATKQAIYSMIYGREASSYSTIGAQGVRVRNAMAQILSNAKAGTTGKISNDIELVTKKLNWNWEIDSIWSNYLSKTYEVKASTSFNTYSVELEGDYPEETKIVNEKNEVKNTFSSGEKFKIVVPIKSFRKEGEFKINVKTKLNTKPVFYGKAPNSGLQDYALTAAIYEDAIGSTKISYFKNNTKVQIEKLEGTKSTPLSNVEFRILDNNKNSVYTNLVTNEQGIVEVSNLIPGEYYLEEIKTNDGYVKLTDPIKFKLSLNQTTKITVYNYQEKKSEYISDIQEIDVGETKQEIIVNENKETTTIQKNESIIDKTYNESNTNINTNKLTNNIAISNKNENINKNDQFQNTNINNENININKNTQNSNTNIQNVNKNTNINENKNQSTNVNENTNLNSNVNENTNESTNINTNINESTNENTNSNTNINTNINENTNSNVNSNILKLNGIVKLPKTGM